MAVLTEYLQESLLTLLCHSKDHARLVRAAIPIELWSRSYEQIAMLVYEYIDQYGEPPRDHLPEVMDKLLTHKDKRESDHHKRNLYFLDEMKDKINAPYILKRLDDFVRRQSIRSAIIEATPLIQDESNPEALDQLERVLSEATKARAMTFNPGINLGNPKQALAFLSKSVEALTTGIPELDRHSAGPIIGGLHLFIAPKGRGKSWWLVNVGYRGLLMKENVIHISLEMPAAQVAQRYLQMWFKIANYEDDDLTRVMFNGDKSTNDMKEMLLKTIRPKYTFKDRNIERELTRLIKSWRDSFGRLYIKDFPSGSLTIDGLEAYLDMMETQHRFVPTRLIIDYPDLMKVPVKDFRLALGRTYVNLRGVAGKRGIALSAATQGTRASIDNSNNTEKMVAEDVSKLWTSDTVLVASQTPAERRVGLMRVTVTNNRSARDNYTVVISQAYPVGQFVVDSWMHNKSYERIFKRDLNTADGGDGDGDGDGAND